MESLLLIEDLSIKKLEPENKKDQILLKTLDKDPLVVGKNGYLWPLENTVFRDLRYLKEGTLYGAHYAIYKNQTPIGFLEISQIFRTQTTNNVHLCYALVRKARGKGYMTKVLNTVSDKLLEDRVEGIDIVGLQIAYNNTASRKVALNAGFTEEEISEDEKKEQGTIYCYKQKVKRR